MNKNNSAVIVIGIIIIILLAYIAFKQKTVPTSPVSPISQSQTSQSSPTPAPQTTKNNASTSPLVATSTTPYSRPLTAINTPLGGPSYLVVKQPISSEAALTGYYLWINPDTGTYKNTNGKLYYNPQPVNLTVQFGASATDEGNTSSLIKAANQQISQQGYALVGHFLSGGPNYEYYFIAQ